MKNAVWVALACLVCCPSLSRASEPTTIAYTASTAGLLEAYPDSTGVRAGGLAARASLLESLDPGLLVEVGGFLRSDVDSDARARVQLACLSLMGYDIVHLAGSDLAALPPDAISRLLRSFDGAWLATNVRPRDSGDWTPVDVLERSLGGRDVRLIGLVGSDAGPAYVVEEPIAAARRLAGDDATPLVVLSDLAPSMNDALLAAVPSIVTIIGTREPVARDRVAPASSGGRTLGTIRLGAAGPELRMRDVIEENENAAVRRTLLDYYHDAAAAASDLPVPHPFDERGQRYVGARACAACHAETYTTWAGTAHARAYDTLVADGVHDRPECVVCHVTGYGQHTGFALDRSRSYVAGVQCEACHGPGGRHSRLPSRSTIQPGSRDACISCHTPEDSPGFHTDLERYLAHGIHEAPAPAGPSLAERLLLPDGPGERPQVDLFVMSLCPYGTAAEKTLIEAWKGFGSAFDLRIRYIVRDAESAAARDQPGAAAGDDACSDDGAEIEVGRFGVGSLHGEPEVLENLTQLAIHRLHPERLFDYLRLRADDFDADWRQLVTQIGLDPDAIQNEASGGAVDALQADAELVRVLGVNASPTVFIDGVAHAGGLRSAFGHALCASMGEPAGFCSMLPACDVDGDCRAPGKLGRCVDGGRRSAQCVYTDAPQVTMHVVNDSECGMCSPAVAVSSAMETFPNLEVVAHDATSPEGIALMERHRIRAVPAYVFDGVQDVADFGGAASLMIETDGEYLLDPAWIGQGPLHVTRPARRGVDVFIHATGGTSRALIDAIDHAVSEVDGDIPITVHHLLERRAPENPDAMRMVQRDGRAVMVPESALPHFGSRLGDADVAEARRQACLDLRHEGVLIDYLTGRGDDVDQPDAWRGRVAALGIDPARLGMCAGAGEADAHLVAGMALADSLGIQRPAVLVGNRLRFDGLGPWNSGALRRALMAMN